eukprot:scaffold6904_cov140-Skeletonema_marinoi.AAC.2
MSLVGAHKKLQLDPAPPLSCDLVLPILDSIISQENNSLKHLLFPYDWREEEVRLRLLEFLERYDGMLENSPTACCGTRLDGLICYDDDWFGIQDWTCSECAKNYCYDCTDEDDSKQLYFCFICGRNYCTSCAAMVACSGCDNSVCVDCIPHTACSNSHCTNVVCNECLHKCGECNKGWCFACDDCMSCEDCYKRCCGECSETVGVNGVHECCNCGSMLCNECRVGECKRNPLDCKECVNMISPLLLEENKKLQEELKSMIACLAKIAIKDAAGSALRRWE